MKKKQKTTILLLTVLVLALQMPHSETPGEKTPAARPERKSGTSFQENSRLPEISDEQLCAIDEVIDSVHSSWQEEVTDLESRAESLERANEALKKESAVLSKKKEFWMRSALYEAGILLTAGAVLYAYNH